MAEKAIILQLRPKIQELLEQQTFTYWDVIDALCAFAQNLAPDVAPETLREIVIEGFNSSFNSKNSEK